MIDESLAWLMASKIPGKLGGSAFSTRKRPPYCRYQWSDSQDCWQACKYFQSTSYIWSQNLRNHLADCGNGQICLNKDEKPALIYMSRPHSNNAACKEPLTNSHRLQLAESPCTGVNSYLPVSSSRSHRTQRITALRAVRKFIN